MIGLDKDAVRLCEHQEEWANDFQKEKQILQNLIGDKVVSIEHVGSTSIPNLKAKPVIDIAIGIKDKSVVPEILKRLEENNYNVKDEWDDKLQKIFVSKGSSKCRTHNLHIEIYGGTNWNNHILFKEYLLKYPEAIRQYENIKIENENKYKDKEDGRKQYKLAKEEVVSKLVEKAKKEFGEVKPLGN